MRQTKAKHQRVEEMSLRTEFIDAMSGLVSSVSIVTTDGSAGKAGATVSALTSVSADGDAPTLLVCLHHETAAAAAILENRCFCVNILNSAQSDIANIFASRTVAKGAEKFASGEFAPLKTGAPSLNSALAVFDCSVISDEQIGTHHVMIGAVQAITCDQGQPLLYGARAYQRLAIS